MYIFLHLSEYTVSEYTKYTVTPLPLLLPCDNHDNSLRKKDSRMP